LLTLLWLELNECTYMQHWIHNFSVITSFLSVKEHLLNYEQKNITHNTRQDNSVFHPTPPLMYSHDILQ
jgi:hypothetical protein